MLVEEGPWPEAEVTDQLRRVQDRLYGCLDAIIDGQIAEAYPDSANKPVEIRLDAYDVPETELSNLSNAFSANVLDIPDYKNALEGNELIPEVFFQLNFDSARKTDEKS